MTAAPGMPRADGLRFMRRVLFVLCIAVAVLAVLLAVAFTSITKSRRDALRITCEQQNVRHDATIRSLDDLIGKLPPGGRRTRARQSRDGTITLIDALAPRFDCGKRVEQLVP